MLPELKMFIHIVGHNKSFLLFFLLYLLPWLTMSQESRQQIHSPAWTSADTAQILSLIAKGSQFYYNTPDSAMYYFRQAEQLSREKHFEDGIGHALHHMGVAATNAGNYETGFKFYREAMPYCLNARYIPDMAANLYIHMGVSYYYTGDYSGSSRYYYMALDQLDNESPGDPLRITIYVNLSGVHARLGDFEKALSYAEKAAQTNEQRNVTRSIHQTGILNNKGYAYIGLGRYDEAYETLTEALKHARYYNLKEVAQSAYCSLGELMMVQGKYREAVDYLREAMQLSSRTNPYYAFIFPRLKLGTAYYHLRQYAEAEKLLLEALQEADRTGLKQDNMNAHAILAAVYEESGRYRESLLQQHLYMKLKDSLLSRQKAEAISELEIRYQTSEKDRDLVQQQLQISRQETRLARKNIWIGGVSLSALLLGIALVIRNRYNKQKQLSQEKQIYILQQQQEINNLRAVMEGEEKERVRIAQELHDGIVSQLLAVRLHFKGAMQQHKGKILHPEAFSDTLQYLDDATKELRATAHNLMPETVLQNGLTVALQTYCRNMSEAARQMLVEYQEVGSIPRLDPNTELSLFRIVQELVQNAIKHSGGDYIFVQLNRQDAVLSVTVEDNGTGIPEHVVSENKGMGLKSIFMRVRALGGQLDISGKDGVGTTAYIEFDLTELPLL